MKAKKPTAEKMEDQTKEKLKEQLGLGTNIVFSFDTTGSMHPCIADVRQKLKDLSKDMFQNIPGLRIGIIAHGDYCDNERCVVALDLTNDLEKILEFLHSTPNTSGGDADECYELALNTARALSWPESGGSLVLIGDADPHGPDYPLNTNHLDWKVELQGLLEKGIKVFPMQCLAKYSKTGFWDEVAKLSQTPLLKLNDFKESADSLEAVAYASAGEEVYDHYAASPKYAAMCCVSEDSLMRTSSLRSYVKGGSSKVVGDMGDDLTHKVTSTSTTLPTDADGGK